MDEATPLTPFDTMTQTREIQMLKTVIPYMKSSQKTICHINKVYGTSKYASYLFTGRAGLIHVLSAGRGNNPQSLLNSLRPFCTPKELETIDMLTNMFSMLETYETIFAG